ncbi:MAG: radical SAM protein, partial [Nanobdellota archaeon]
MTKIGFSTEIVNQKEVVVNLTEKCNNMCLSCPNDESFLKNIIKKEDIEDFIKKKVEKNTDRVTFIGGEPTIAKNFFKLIELIRRINKNVIIQINTNGRMFYYDTFVQKLARHGPDKFDIHIAFYGSNSDLHDKLTGVNGSFQQTSKGIVNLLKLGFHIQIRTIISKINYKDIPNMAKLMSTKFKNKITKFNFVGMDIIGNAKKNKDILAISHLEIAPFIEKAIDILNHNKTPCEIHLLPKGIFKREYHRYAIMSGCVDGAFTDSYGCKECFYRGRCPRLLKSYVEIFGNKEHLPCLKREENICLK